MLIILQHQLLWTTLSTCLPSQFDLSSKLSVWSDQFSLISSHLFSFHIANFDNYFFLANFDQLSLFLAKFDTICSLLANFDNYFLMSKFWSDLLLSVIICSISCFCWNLFILYFASFILHCKLHDAQIEQLWVNL